MSVSPHSNFKATGCYTWSASYSEAKNVMANTTGEGRESLRVVTSQRGYTAMRSKRAKRLIMESLIKGPPRKDNLS